MAAQNGDDMEQFRKLHANVQEIDQAVATNAAQNNDLYRELVKAASSSKSDRVKTLAVEYIPKYFEYFPELRFEAYMALVDLCEEDTLSIQLKAIASFPVIGRVDKSYCGKASIILGQMTADEGSAQQVKNSLWELMQIAPADVLSSLFTLIIESNNFRLPIFAFLEENVLPKMSDFLKSEGFVQTLVQKLKETIAAGVNDDELVQLLNILSRVPKSDQTTHTSDIVEMLAKHAQLSKPFDENNLESLVTVLESGRTILRNLSMMSVQPFVAYFHTHVIPNYSNLKEESKSKALMSLASAASLSNADNARLLMPIVFPIFESLVPFEETNPTIHFSKVERLLFVIHHLATKAPNALSKVTGMPTVYTGQPSDFDAAPINAEEKLSIFRKRLTLLKGVADRSLKEFVEGEKRLGSDATPEDKLRVSVGRRSCGNIGKLVELLLRKKPSYGTSGVLPSWVPEPQGEKRKSNADNSQSGKRGRGGRSRGGGHRGGAPRGGGHRGGAPRGRGGPKGYRPSRGGNRGRRGRGGN